MTHREYDPISPQLSRGVEVGELLHWWQRAPMRARVLILLYMAAGAWGGLYGGFTLAHEYRNLLTWSISFLILEPVGVACLFGFLYLVSAGSLGGTLLSRALGRAKVAVVLVFVAGAGVLVINFGFLLFELWRAS